MIIPLEAAKSARTLGDGDSRLRPGRLTEFVGQQQTKQILRVAIEGATKRNEPLRHVLLCGPAGLGKTTLAEIIAKEMGAPIKIASGALMQKRDLSLALLSMKPKQIFFVDEIHRLPAAMGEILYPAMDRFRIDIPVGPGAQIKVSPFTLVGATTRPDLLAAPFRDRFGLIIRLSAYTDQEIAEIVLRAARILGMNLEPSGAAEIARRSRGVPRIANNLLLHLRDCAGGQEITRTMAQEALNVLGIDQRGLDEIDRQLLQALSQTNTLGLSSLAARTGEEKTIIEQVHEPHLLRLGLIARTARGRVLTPEGREHLNTQK